MNKKSLFQSNVAYNLLYVIISLFFISLISLSFFNHPSQDDFFAGYHQSTEGFWGFQRQIYLHWGGRYTSNLLTAIFTFKYFLFKYYFAHTPLLILATLLSVYFFLNTINNFWLNKMAKPHHLALITCLLTINTFCNYLSLSNALYWFSSAITYQLSLVWLLLFFSSSITFLFTHNAFEKKWAFIGQLVFIILLNGSNEVIALITGALFITLLFVNPKKAITNLVHLLIIGSIYIASIAILALAPGNQERLALIDSKNIIYSILSTFIHIGLTLWHLFQSPLWWISSLGIYVFALKYQSHTLLLKKNKHPLKAILILAIIWCIILAIILLPLMYISNGSFPARADNVLSFSTTIIFTMIIFYAGLCTENQHLQKIAEEPNWQYVLPILLCLTIICNSTAKDIFNSIASSKTYHTLLRNQEQTLQQASSTKEKSAFIQTLDTALDSLTNNKNPSHTPSTLQKLIYQKPPLLFIHNDYEDSLSIEVIKNYYGLSKIELRK